MAKTWHANQTQTITLLSTRDAVNKTIDAHVAITVKVDADADADGDAQVESKQHLRGTLVGHGCGCS